MTGQDKPDIKTKRLFVTMIIPQRIIRPHVMVENL
jgi:hypothetical protein